MICSDFLVLVRILAAFDMTTKTKVCLQNHPKMFDLIFSCLTPRVKICIHLENFIFFFQMQLLQFSPYLTEESSGKSNC